MARAKICAHTDQCTLTNAVNPNTATWEASSPRARGPRALGEGVARPCLAHSGVELGLVGAGGTDGAVAGGAQIVLVGFRDPLRVRRQQLEDLAASPRGWWCAGAGPRSSSQSGASTRASPRTELTGATDLTHARHALIETVFADLID